MPTILLVEDEPQARELWARVLRKAGYEIIALDSVEKARMIYKPGEIDLVLSDNKCPQDNNGRDWLKELQPNQKVLLMSGQNVEDLGNLPLIAKPIDTAELLAKVAEILGQSTPPD